MSEQYSYPEREHYQFPKNIIEQAREELRFYGEPVEFQKNLVALKRMYAKTPFMKSMEIYATIAASLQTNQIKEATKQRPNVDFFGGALMGAHINLAPAPTHIKQYVLRQSFIADLHGDTEHSSVLGEVSDRMAEWAGGEENNWHEFLADQPVDFQDAVVELATTLYADRDDSEDRQLDFMVGFTFATNFVWLASKEAEPLYSV